MTEEPLVTSGEVVREFGIARTTLQRLIDDGRVPAYDVSHTWNKRKQWRFKLSEVRAALGPPPATGDDQ